MLSFILLLSLISYCWGIEPVYTHRPNVPIPTIRYNDDKYPNNFITTEKASSMKVYWEVRIHEERSDSYSYGTNNAFSDRRFASLRRSLLSQSDQSSNTPPIRGYQLEYAILDNVKSIVDTNAPDTASPIDFQVYATDIGMTTAGNTVQILTVRADSTLDGAETYKLALPYGTEKTMQPLYDSER